MRIWCARKKRGVFIEKTCLKCPKAYKCSRFSVITITSFDRITKNKNLKKKLQKLLDLFKFINEDKHPICEGW